MLSIYVTIFVVIATRIESQTIGIRFDSKFSFVLIFILTEPQGIFSVTYPGFGTFTIHDFYHILYRPIVLLPNSPEDIDPDFLLFTRDSDNSERLSYNDSSALLSSDFDEARNTKIIVPGFNNNIDNAKYLTKMKNEFLKYEDLNVIIVDWRKGNGLPYSQAVANVRITGMMVGKFIEMATNKTDANIDSFHLIGHSLGAHLIGMAGKYLNGSLKHITGLDPAGPFYEGLTDPASRLWHTDAKFVEAIHTDVVSLIPRIGLGMNETCGNVDVFVNGGGHQPNCEQGFFDYIKEEGLLG